MISFQTRITRPSSVVKTVFFGLAFFGALATITYLSLYPLPFEPPDLGFDAIDKVGHALAYATAMVLGCFYWRERGRFNSVSRPHLRNLGLLLFGYGTIIEVLQHILPVNRWAEIWDVLANGLGILIGGIVFHFLFNRSSVKKA